MTRHCLFVSMCFALLVSLMMLGLVGIGYSQSSTAVLCVSPSSVIDPSLQSPRNFTVSVEITNVSMLYSVEFKLFWNATLLDLAQVSLFAPWKNGYVACNDNATPGEYWLSVILAPPASSVNGTSSIVSLTFRVKAIGGTALHFADTVLGDENANPIGHEIIDGFFSNSIHDVVIVSFEVWPTYIYQGDPIYMNLTVENDGTYNEQCNLLVYADRTDNGVHVNIANQSVVVNAGELESFHFTWNTTGVPYGSYLVTAKADVASDVTLVNNVAHGLVGGICVRPHPIPFSMLSLVVAAAYGIVPVFLFGIIVLGIFKLVTSTRFKRFDLPMPRVRHLYIGC